MKSIFIFLVSCCCSICLFAQPSIPASILLDIGDTQEVHYSETPFNPGDAGANVIWDFSQIPDSYLIEWEALEPANTPFAQQFPGANIAFFVPQDVNTQTDSWAYYRRDNNNQFDFLGSALVSSTNMSNDTSVYSITEDPDQLYQFPINYNDNFQDSVKGISTVSTNGVTLSTQREGNTTTEADAYGTLITPLGQFENVMRIKRTENIADFFMSIPTFQEVIRYDWVSADGQYLLYHTEETIIKDFLGNEQNRTSQTYFAEQMIISSLSVHPKKSTFNLYPNPTTNYLQLPEEFHDQLLTIQIINSQGKLVRQYEHNSKDKISVEDLFSGTYIIRTIHNNHIYQTKFIKI